MTTYTYTGDVVHDPDVFKGVPKQYRDENGDVIKDENYQFPPIVGTSNCCLHPAMRSGNWRYDVEDWDDEKTASIRNKYQNSGIQPSDEFWTEDDRPSTIPESVYYVESTVSKQEAAKAE